MRNISIFIVSLEKSKERREKISYSLEKLNLSYTFFDAVDGSKFSGGELVKIQESCQSLVKHRSFPMQRGEIGCLMSHFNLYKEILSKKIEWACVLEDDARLTEHFYSCLAVNNFTKLNRAPLVVMLGHHFGNINKGVNYSFWGKIKVTNKIRFAVPIERNSGSYGYIMNSKAARILANECSKFNVPIDTVLGSSELIGVKRFVASPPVVKVEKHNDNLMSERDKKIKKIHLQPKAAFKIRFKRHLYRITIKKLKLLMLKLGLVSIKKHMELSKIG